MQIHLRIKGTPQRKANWVRAAKGRPLADVAGEVLDAWAENERWRNAAKEAREAGGLIGRK